MVNQYKQQLDQMMKHELSRADFLKFMGVAALGFVGVIGFFNNLRDVHPAKVSKKLKSGGYGKSAYGR